MTEDFIKEFISQAIHRIDENTQKLATCLHDLEESEIWKRPNQHSNSVGNIILHLCGNIRQYAISSLGHWKMFVKEIKNFRLMEVIPDRSC